MWWGGEVSDLKARVRSLSEEAEQACGQAREGKCQCGNVRGEVAVWHVVCVCVLWWWWCGGWGYVLGRERSQCER